MWLVRTDKELRLYVGGKYAGSEAVINPKSSLARLLLGGSKFIGRIDQLRVSKIARYDSKDFTPPPSLENDIDTLTLYRFEEGAGDKLTDASGNGHHGRIVGAQWVKANGAPIAAATDPLELHFEPDQSVEIASLRIPQTGPVTLEAFVTPAKKTLNNPSAITANGRLSLLLLDSSRPTWAFYTHQKNQDSSLTAIKGPPFVILGKRVHIACVRSDAKHRLFVDGVLVAEARAGKLEELLPGVTLGGKTFAGRIDEVRFSKVARYDKDFVPSQRFEPDADTLALYHCDEGQGDKLIDSSGNNHHGKIVGAEWVKADGTAMVAASAGRFGLKFAGPDDAMGPISVGLEPSQPFTLEGYADPENKALSQHIFSTTNSLLLRAVNPKWHFNLRGQEKVTPLAHSIVAPMKAGKSAHVAAVFNGKEILLFVDGKLAETKSIVGDVPKKGPIPLTIGHNFHGTLRELRISKIARYDKDFTPLKRFEPDKDTLALYHMDEGQGDKLTDSSGNGHHGKIDGAKWVRADGTPIAAPKTAFKILQRYDWPNRDGLSILSVDVSKDGKYVQASRIDDKALTSRVWDTTANAKPALIPAGLGRFVRGNLIAAIGTGQQSVQYYLEGGGKSFMNFKVPAASIIQMTPSADYAWFLTLKKEVEIWNAWKAPGKMCSFPFTINDTGVLMPDGKHFLHQVGLKPPLIVRDTATGKPVDDAYAQLRNVPPIVTVSADGRRLLCLGDNQIVQVFDVATGKEVAPLENGPRLNAAISGDGSRVLGFGGTPGKLELWDVATGKSLGVLPMPAANAYRLSHDGMYAVVGDKNAVYLIRLSEDSTKSTAAPLDPAWLKAVAAITAEKQVEEVKAELIKRNPGLDGNVQWTKPVVDVASLSFSTEYVTDISPLRAFQELQILDCSTLGVAKVGPLTDLSPLQGMKLSILKLAQTRVADLSPLKGMPLAQLLIYDTSVTDLSPLNGMPLEGLRITNTNVADLSPLKGMKLTLLEIGSTNVSDLAPLQGMPLSHLSCPKTRVADLSPLKGMALERLNAYDAPIADLTPLNGTKIKFLSLVRRQVTDFSPLKATELESLECDFRAARDAEVLRSIKTLQSINNKPAAEVLK